MLNELQKTIGNMVFGTPEKLGMPADFHLPPQLRQPAKSSSYKDIRAQIAVNLYRRAMTVYALRAQRKYVALLLIVGVAAILAIDGARTVILHFMHK